MLSGHMDVVPALEADWRSDPFTLTRMRRRYCRPRGRRHEGLPGAGRQPHGGARSDDGSGGRSRCSSPTTRRPGRSARGGSPRPGPRPSVCRARSSSASRPRCGWCARTRACFDSGSGSRASPPIRAIPTWATTRSSPRRAPSWRSSELRRQHGGWSARHTSEQFPEVPFAALNVGTIAGGSATQRGPGPLRGRPRHPAAARHDGRRDDRPGAGDGRATRSGGAVHARACEPEPAHDRPGRRADPPRAVRGGGPARGAQRHVRDRRRLAAGRRIPSASSSGRAASRLRTGPTSSCRSRSCDARATCWTALDPPALRGGMSRVLEAELTWTGAAFEPRDPDRDRRRRTDRGGRPRSDAAPVPSG